MAQATRLLTAEEFFEMPEIPGVWYELVRGEVVEVSGTDGEHGDFVLAIVTLLHAFIRPRRLGKLYADGVGFIIRRDPDTVRIPDVAFVARSRVPVSGSPKKHWPLAPDLAVEIVSPGDRRHAVEEKTQGYLAAGTRMAWVLWPEQQTAVVYTQSGTRTLTAADTLGGGDVLPEFTVSVAALFAVDL